MDEKMIARGTLKDSKAFCMALPIIGLIVTIIYDFSVSHGRLSYGFGFGNGANLVLYPLIIVLAIVAFVIYKRWSKVQITVTNKRVYGFDAMGKRVDLPLDSITAVGTSIFSGLAVTTASGAINSPCSKTSRRITRRNQQAVG